MKLPILWLSLVIFGCQGIYAQKIPCGNQILESVYRAKDPNYDSTQYAFNRQVKNWLATHDLSNNSSRLLLSGNTFTIPVVVHVIKTPGMSYGTGTNISYAQIQSQINALNVAFAASLPNYQGMYSVDTKIQFCLARNTEPSSLNWSLDPLSNIEYGVMRYDVPNLSDPAINVTLPTATSVSFEPFVLASNSASTNTFNKKNYLNIWIVDQILLITPSFTGPAAGVYFNDNPLGMNQTEGILVDVKFFGENTLTGNSYNLYTGREDGKTVVHEVGHYFGLNHTFFPNNGLNPMPSSFCYGTEAAGSTNDPCDLYGDGICDIAPMSAGSTGLCNPLARPNSCLESYVPACGTDDLPSDYMSYEDDPCVNTFTYDQKLRMWATLNIKWSNLWSVGNLIRTGLIGTGGCVANSTLNSDIMVSEAYACTGAPITFSTLACYSGNSAVNWDWDLTGSSTPLYNSSSCSSASPPSVTYSAPGTYNISLTVTDALSNTQTSTIQLLVTDCVLDPSKKDQANWHFGYYVSLDFNTGVPVKNDNTFTPQTSVNAVSSLHSSVSDNTGTDLYYTNGVDAWKVSGGVPTKINTGGPLPSVYSGLFTNNLGQSVRRGYGSSISFPAPGFPNRYYIFNTPDGFSSNIMNAKGGYALIDLSSGTVVSQGLLPLPSCASTDVLTTAITAIPHCNGKDYWVIYYSRQNRRFYVYLVTQNGITNNAFTSADADAYPSCTTSFVADPFETVQLQLKASPLGNKIALSGLDLALYDFNPATGAISNEVITPHYYGAGRYKGCSFSPNGLYVYATAPAGNSGLTINDYVIKYDIATNTNTPILLPSNTIPANMQLGPNNHLYFTNLGVLTHLNEIPNPDALSGNVAAMLNVSLITTAGAAGTPLKMANNGGTLVNNIDAAMPPYVTPDFSITNSIPGCPTYLFEINNCYKHYTVTWNYGDGSPAGSGISSTHMFNPGLYTITATLSGPLVTYPIIITHPLNVTSPGAPVATTAGSVVGCSSSPAVNIGGATVPGTTYSWLPVTGLSSSSIADPTANPGAYTVYTLTATNMCGSVTNTVAYYPAGDYCCTLPSAGNMLGSDYGVTNIPGTFLTYSGSSPLGTADIVISGTLVINQATSWTNVKVRMEPQAKIEITSAGSLSLNGCNLFSCSELWWGIQLLTTGNVAGRVTFNNCIVEDMYQGIVVDWQNTAATTPNGLQGRIGSGNSVFNKNYMSIQVLKNTGYGSSYYPLAVRSTTFNTVSSATSPGTSLKPSLIYTYNYNDVSNPSVPYVQFPRAFVGIYITKVTRNSILIGDSANASTTNLFDNLDIGIAVKDNNTEIKNNNFTNLTGSPKQTGASGILETGVGIVADHSVGSKYKLIVGSGNATPASASSAYPKGNSFDACNKAVYSGNVANTIAKGNYLYASSTPLYSPSLPIPTYYSWIAQNGIFLTEATEKVNISYNHISNLRTGIYVSQKITTPAQGLIAISSNSITAPDASGYCEAAIRLEQPVTTYTLNYNTVSVSQNTIQQVYNGIVANNLKGGLYVSVNPLISMDQSKTYGVTASYVRSGIALTNCYGGVVANNPNITFTGSGVNSGNYTRANGVWLTNSFSGVVNCNVVSQAGRCFLFTGNCVNAWLVNSMADSYHGLEINSNGVIGPQGAASGTSNQSGNLWTTITHAETYVDNSSNVNTSATPCFSPLYVKANTASPIHTAPILNLASISGEEYQTGASLGIRVVGGSSEYCATALPPGGGGGSSIMANSGEETTNTAETQELSSGEILSLYPNPNEGNMQLRYKLNANVNTKLFVTDVAGRVLESYDLPGTEGLLQIKLNQLSEGLYFYTIEQNGRTIKKDKFIIMK